MRGVGNGGIITDGLFFSVDAFNLKSYIPPIFTPTTSNVTCASYSNWSITRISDSTKQPMLIGIPGNVQSTWTGYINGGTLPLLLGGGAIPETYNINKALYDGISTTVLYQNPTANFVTMSHTCSIGNWYSGSTNFIKISSADFSGIFNAYLLSSSPLIFSLTGGGSPVSIVSATGASYSGFAIGKSTISVDGYAVGKWTSYISQSGGTLSVSLSGGSIPEVYSINNATSDGYNTILHPTPILSTPVTMSHTCSISAPFGFDCIKIDGVNLSGVFTVYLGVTPSLIFGLTGGAIPETYTASSAYFDGVDTYLYTYPIPTSYNDHTQFNVSVPSITGTLYTDNNVFTFSTPNFSETYSVDITYFDGTDTYLYDSGFVGASYSGHASFSVVVPEMVGTLYTDHTNATFSYILVTPQTASYDMTKRNHNCALENGVGFDGRSFVFDGIDDNISVGDIGTFSEFTLDMWFKSTSITNYKNLIDFNGGNTCLRIEQYSYPGFVHTWKNRTNNAATGVTRLSVNFNLFGDGFGIGGDCKGTIVEGEWYNLVAICDSPGVVVPRYDCVSFWDGMVIGSIDGAFTAPKLPLILNSGYLTWQNYISAGGGQLTLTFSNGTYSLTYSVTTAKYYDNNQTVLFPDANPSIGDTYSGIFSLGEYSGIDCIRLNDNSTYSSISYPWGTLFDKYLAAWGSLTMSLYAGTYSETYLVDSVAYTSPYYYIYDSSLIGLVTGITNSAFVSYTASFPQIPEVDPNRLSPMLYNQVEGNVSASNIYSVYLNNERLVNWVGDFGFVGYASNMRIGDGYDYSSRRFQGSIPYVAMYNRPLSSEEISNNYNSLKWRFT